MKRCILSMMAVFVFMGLRAQTNNGEALSNHIANKMKDSLSLSTDQRNSIYSINQLLHRQKQQVRLQSPAADSLAHKLQRVEHSRDSLYRPVLGEEKYTLYQQKKTQLINAN